MTAAGVLYVTNTDVAGLVTEAETPDQLETKVKTMVRELLELNEPGVALDDDVPFTLIFEKHVPARSG